MEVAEKVEEFRQHLESARREIGKRIIGQDEAVSQILICLLSGGHALLEGAPGLGKTWLVKTIADIMDLRMNRIQFTPDLMPADIIGTNVLTEDERGATKVVFQPGPVFSQVLLADEINRATPKTQSALLEAMQETQITTGGVRHLLEKPFFVLATQNPIEMEGTYPLPEAQQDRFLFKIIIPYPGVHDLARILDLTTSNEEPVVQKILGAQGLAAMQELVRTVVLSAEVRDYVIRLVMAGHPESHGASEMARRYVKYGPSPRGAQSVVLAAKTRALIEGRFNVSFEDVRAVLTPALRHRIILNFEGEAEGLGTAEIITDLISAVSELPRPGAR